MSNIFHSDGGYINEKKPLSTKIIPQESFVLFDTQDGALSTVSKSGESGLSHYISSVFVSYSDLATVGGVVIKDNGSVVLDIDFKGDKSISPNTPIKISEGSSLTVELKEGAIGVIGKLNVIGFTV